MSSLQEREERSARTSSRCPARPHRTPAGDQCPLQPLHGGQPGEVKRPHYSLDCRRYAHVRFETPCPGLMCSHQGRGAALGMPLTPSPAALTTAPAAAGGPAPWLRPSPTWHHSLLLPAETQTPSPSPRPVPLGFQYLKFQAYMRWSSRLAELGWTWGPWSAWGLIPSRGPWPPRKNRRSWA